MKLVLVLLLASLTATVRSGGFSYSSGWSPGQTVTSQRPESTESLNAETLANARFSWSSLFTSGPLSSLLSSSGINITQKLEEAQSRVSGLPWDSRIPMITDDNFEELIITERFTTKEEEESRLWFLLVTVTSSQRTGVSALLDEQFNEAYNISLNEQDLPNVRWGRIDYFTVTRLTTKWAVWRAPVLIVAQKRGKTLRFFYPQQIGARAPQLREFLLRENWKRWTPWDGPWAPGGSREELLDKFAVFQEKLYIYMTKIPRWMYFIISAVFGSLILQLCHRQPKRTLGEKVHTAQPVSSAPSGEEHKDSVSQPDPSTGQSRRSGSQRRKGIKK